MSMHKAINPDTGKEEWINDGPAFARNKYLGATGTNSRHNRNVKGKTDSAIKKLSTMSKWRSEHYIRGLKDDDGLRKKTYKLKRSDWIKAELDGEKT